MNKKILNWIMNELNFIEKNLLMIEKDINLVESAIKGNLGDILEAR